MQVGHEVVIGEAPMDLGSSTVRPANRAKSPTLKVSKWVNPCVRMAATMRASWAILP